MGDSLQHARLCETLGVSFTRAEGSRMGGVKEQHLPGHHSALYIDPPRTCGESGAFFRSSGRGEDEQALQARLILKSCLLHGKRSDLRVGIPRPLSSWASRLSHGASISINGGFSAEGTGWRCRKPAYGSMWK